MSVTRSIMKVIRSPEPSTDLMTQCFVVIRWSYCREGSKCYRKDRPYNFFKSVAEAGVQREVDFCSQQEKKPQQKNIIILKFISHLKKNTAWAFSFTPAGSLDTATRQETNHFMHLTLYKMMSHFSASIRSTEAKRYKGEREKNKGGGGEDCGKCGDRNVLHYRLKICYLSFFHPPVHRLKHWVTSLLPHNTEMDCLQIQ